MRASISPYIDLSMMRSARAFALFFSLMAYGTAVAAQIIVSAEGREIILNDDGTWRYASDARLITTEDGKQVRLGADGRWEMTGNAPLTTDEQVRTTGVDLKLDRVVVETYEKKVQKNTRVRTQTVFYIDLLYDSEDNKQSYINQHTKEKIEIIDSEGNTYPVITVQPSGILKAGVKTTLMIRAEKSPSVFDDASSMSITFNKGLFGLDRKVMLTMKVNDFGSKRVDAFEYR